ncbi:hypothetical protein [Pedobacter immunditicola]|uniref:hypothetical protein n=1 Tax=Pedobacter immunditicola TaxID=3133440 RepID=UPI0030A0BE28
MKIFITSILILASGALAVLEKTGKLVDQSKVSYNINDEKLLDGVYTIADTAHVTRLRGSYAQNKRVGNWYCFNAQGKVVLRYNYDLNKLVALEKEELNAVEIKILDKNAKVAEKASVPIPVCSIDQYKSLMVAELKDELSRHDKLSAGNVDAKITALVKADGTAIYTAQYNLSGVSYTTKIYPKDKLFTIQWLPAAYEGKALKSEFTFVSSFMFKPGDHKRFIWNY